MALGRTSTRVLYALMKGPLSKKKLARAINRSTSSIELAISDLRKQNVNLHTVGSHPHYKYEYGGRNGQNISK